MISRRRTFKTDSDIKTFVVPLLYIHKYFFIRIYNKLVYDTMTRGKFYKIQRIIRKEPTRRQYILNLHSNVLELLLAKNNAPKLFLYTLRFEGLSQIFHIECLTSRSFHILIAHKLHQQRFPSK